MKEFHIFSTCCSFCSPGKSGLYFLEPLVLAATCPCALRQSTAALGRISSIFYVKSGLGSPCSSHLEIWNYFYEQYLAADETSRTCVSLRCFWKNFTYFHRVGCPGFPAQFALENLDIIFTCSHMAVGGWFSAALTHFSRSSGLSRSWAPVFGALDDEEFFVVEGSCTISCSALVNRNISPEGSRQKQQPLH